MTPFVLGSLRLFLRTLARIAPRTAGRLAYRLFSTPRIRSAIPGAMESVMDRAEKLEVEVDSQAVAVYRWSASGQGEKAPRALLVHGWESRAGRLAIWVEPLLAAGYEVVAFDAPAHGLSEGRRAHPAIFGKAIRAVSRRVGPPTVAIGHSVGGLSLIGAIGAADRLGVEPIRPERMVILGGAESGSDALRMFCEVLGLGADFLPLIHRAIEEIHGFPLSTFDGHRVFVDHPVPTLWFHDHGDEDVPLEAAERVARTCPHVRLERTEGLGHNRIARDPEILRRAIRFLIRSDERSAVA